MGWALTDIIFENTFGDMADLEGSGGLGTPKAPFQLACKLVVYGRCCETSNQLLVGISHCRGLQSKCDRLELIEFESPGDCQGREIVWVLLNSKNFLYIIQIQTIIGHDWGWQLLTIIKIGSCLGRIQIAIPKCMRTQWKRKCSV